MKTSTTIFLLALMGALGSLGHISAQTTLPPTHLDADTVLVSEYHKADSLIRRYQINTTQEDEIALHYRINLSSLSEHYMDNSEELSRLDRFMQQLGGDSSYTLKRVVVEGFASPDGPIALNERLAKARMDNLLSYLGKHYTLSGVQVQSSWRVHPWQAVLPWLEHSALQEREVAVGLVKGGGSSPEKELQLKRMPAVWSYLKDEVLPALRYAEVKLILKQSSYVEERSYIVPPKPAPKPEVRESPCADPCGECVVVDEGITGFIVELEE